MTGIVLAVFGALIIVMALINAWRREKVAPAILAALAGAILMAVAFPH